MVVLIIFPVILQTVINVIMLTIGRQGVTQMSNVNNQALTVAVAHG